MYLTTLINKNNKKLKVEEIKDFKGNDVLLEKNTKDAFLKLKEFLKEKGILIDINKVYNSLEIEVFLNDFSYYNEVSSYLTDFGFKVTNSMYRIIYVGKIPARIMMNNNWSLEEYVDNFSGIIAVNKEKGMTSFDVVKEISHLFGIKKVGHTGTLDPLAEGVMIVAIGKATKVVELLTAYEKEYVATVKLGIITDTLDIDGEVLERKDIPSDIDILEGLNHFKKTYMQEVPIYSAIKVEGKKLYEYARGKKEVELPKKEVTVKEIELLDRNSDTFKFRSIVSKGCYIRSLIRDICDYLGIIGTMSSLVRTKQGNITINDTYTLNDIISGNYKILSIKDVLNYPVIVVEDYLAFKISNGVIIDNKWNITDKVIFQKENGKILGIYQAVNGKLQVWKNF